MGYPVKYRSYYVFVITVMFLMIHETAHSYEKAFEKTPVGTIEMKNLPAARTLNTSISGRYFEHSGGLFRKLFNYIKRNDVAMTIPVQSDVAEGQMRFFVGRDDLNRDLKDEDGVRYTQLPERKVVSIGARGAYTEKNFLKARSRLEEWIRDHPEYDVSGDAYAVYWNGPFMLWFLKRFEVHIPIRSE